MDYNLAKKLKDAGFPQETINYFVAQVQDKYTKNGRMTTKPTGTYCVMNKNELEIFHSTPKCSAPTLSELIEACGGEFKNLSHGGDFYLTYPGVPYYANYENDDGEESWGGEGSTPEEAVANLWLALNNK